MSYQCFFTCWLFLFSRVIILEIDVITSLSRRWFHTVSTWKSQITCSLPYGISTSYILLLGWALIYFASRMQQGRHAEVRRSKDDLEPTNTTLSVFQKRERVFIIAAKPIPHASSDVSYWLVKVVMPRYHAVDFSSPVLFTYFIDMFALLQWMLRAVTSIWIALYKCLITYLWDALIFNICLDIYLLWYNNTISVITRSRAIFPRHDFSSCL